MTADHLLHLPTGETLTIRATGGDTGGARFEFDAVLPPGLSGPPPHRHRAEAETFTVLAGRLRVRLGRRTVDLDAGESVTVPPGTTHGFANPFDEPARIRTVEAPAGPLEAQLRALADSGRFPPVRRLARINVEHGLSFSVAGVPDAVQRPLWRGLAALPAPARSGGFVDAAAAARFRAAYADAMALLPTPAAVQDVPTGFGRVRVYRFGEPRGVPLVLLPGKGGTTAMWAPNLPGWAARRPVYAVEPLGEPGPSEPTRPVRTPADQAGWLAGTLRGLDVERAHLVGASLGGWLAVNLARHDPAPVASLSLLEPAGVFARFAPRFLLASLGALPGSPEPVRARVLRWLADGAEVGTDPTGRLLTAGTGGFRASTPAPRYPDDAELRGLRVPTLVLLGGRSRIHDPRRAVARARALLPDATVELWPDAGHAISGQCAERVTARVLEFVAAVEDRRTSSGF